MEWGYQTGDFDKTMCVKHEGQNVIIAQGIYEDGILFESTSQS